MGEEARKVIDSFTGEYAFLSNFWMTPVEFEGATYPSVEHAYQAAKTTRQTERESVRLAKTPGRAKQLGQGVTLRKDWDLIKVATMRALVAWKFTRDLECERKLLSTGDAKLIEGNTWNDTFWGVCRGVGRNNLGLILEKLRDDIRGALEHGYEIQAR